MIKRRSLLQASAAASAATLPGFVLGQQAPVTMKFHTFMAPQSNVWRTMHMAWMDKVEREANGRVRFERFPAMQLGGTPPQLYDQARDGVADITWTLPGNSPGRFPRTEVFELPFMMSNAEATSRAMWDYCSNQAREEFREVQPIAFQVHGPGAFHSREKLIRNVGDLRGMKVRGPTRQVTKLLAALGATPVGMPLPQIPDALSKGVIDAAVIPWEVVPSIKVDELCKFHSETPAGAGALYTTTFVMGMNKARYDALPPDVKRVIDANSGIETSAFLGRTQQGNDPAGRKTATDRNNTIHTFTAAEMAEFRRAADLVDDEWVKEMNGRGANGTQLLADAKALIARYSR
jgi:TRAP-type transport system periplasmic protein